MGAGEAGVCAGGGRQLLSLYNSMVLPHLQYCLMVWGDLRGDRNATLGGALLRYQKRFAGLAAGRRGRYHADPLLAEHGMLKLGSLPAAVEGACVAFLEWSAAGKPGGHAEPGDGRAPSQNVIYILLLAVFNDIVTEKINIVLTVIRGDGRSNDL